MEEELENRNGQDLPLIASLSEQFKLPDVPKNRRRCSTTTIMTAFLWQLNSIALHKKLQEMFILPFLRWLKSLSSESIETGRLDFNYLRRRTMGLSSEGKVVTLIIGEVYTAQRVEYNNGSFVDVTDNSTSSKTVLAFMIQSTHGKYKDIACLIALSKLDPKIHQKRFDKVMVALNKILFAVDISIDNHICNR